MRRTLTQVFACAAMVGATVALWPARPAAQAQGQAALNQAASPDALARAQANYQADQQREAIAQNKGAVVASLIDRWRANIGTSEKSQLFESSFMNADPDKLLRMTQAKSWDEVVALQLGLSPDATLGSAANDLVFTPVTPCRVMDSRLGSGVYAGPYTSGQTVSLYVTDSLTANGHAQGGAASCGFPFNIGAAAALNITVVPITGSGDLKIFPFPGPSPNSSIINFYAGLNLANSTSAGIALSNATNDLSITVEFASSVHIIVDILGYYSAPQTAALQNTRVASVGTSLGPGGNISVDTPVCPSGYAMTGGGYNMTGAITDLNVWQNGPADNPTTTWRFRGYNSGASTMTVTVYGVCARTPGR